MTSWNVEQVELKLRQSLKESLSNVLYFDSIDYQVYGLDYQEAKKVVKKYCEHIYGDNYKYGKTWVTVEPDRIKIEKR
jgi:hypothetical protein